MLSQKQGENRQLTEKAHLARHPEPLTINFNLPFSLFCSLWPVFSLMSFSVQELCGLGESDSPSPSCKGGFDYFKLLQILIDLPIKR